MVYSADGTRLYTGGADGGLCVYDVPQVYQPTKFLSGGVKDLKVWFVYDMYTVCMCVCVSVYDEPQVCQSAKLFGVWKT